MLSLLPPCLPACAGSGGRKGRYPATGMGSPISFSVVLLSLLQSFSALTERSTPYSFPLALSNPEQAKSRVAVACLRTISSSSDGVA